jgi:two-component system, NarL family, sensor histidine kinase UhpB
VGAASLGVEMALIQYVGREEPPRAIARPLLRVDPSTGSIDLLPWPDRCSAGTNAPAGDDRDGQADLRLLARELHDVVGQDLTAIHLSLLAAQRATDPDELGARIGIGLALVDRALSDVRTIASNARLTALENGGLTVALREYLVWQRQASGVPTELLGLVSCRVASQVESAAYRIVQEAVTNAVRHAQPGRVVVRLERDADELVVEVEDDGCGFEIVAAINAGNALGIVSIYERAYLSGGRVELWSERFRGTRVTVRFGI